MTKTSVLHPVLAATLLFGLILHTVIPAALPYVPGANAVNRSITLVGFIAAWNNTSVKPNPTIAVLQGDAIALLLSSGDGAPHQFFIDVDNTGTVPNCNKDKCSAFFPPSTTYQFTADMPIGTFKYYCTVHPATMLGTFEAVNVVGGVPLQPNVLALLVPFITVALIFLGGSGAVFVFARRIRQRPRKQQ